MKNKRIEKSLQKLMKASDELLEENGVFLQTFGRRVFEIAESGDFPRFYALVNAVRAIMEEGIDKAMKCAKGRPVNH